VKICSFPPCIPKLLDKGGSRVKKKKKKKKKKNPKQGKKIKEK
jgi:hypothetical protein